MKLAFSFISLLLLFSNTLQTKFDTEKSITEIKSKESLEKMFQTYDTLSILFIYTEDPLESLQDKYIAISKSVYYYGEFYFMSCKVFSQLKIKNYPFCSPESKSLEPYLVVIKPPDMRQNPYTKEPMNHTLAFLGFNDLTTFPQTKIERFIGDRTTDETVHIDHNEIEKFESQEIFNMILLASNKTEASPIFRALAKSFRGKLVFSYSSDPKVFSHYKIKNLPQIIGIHLVDPVRIKKVDKKIEFYKGEVDFHNISLFCSKFARKENITYEEARAFSSGETKRESNVKSSGYLTIADSNYSIIYESDLPIVLSIYNENPNQFALNLSQAVKGLFEFYFVQNNSKSEKIIEKFKLNNQKTGKLFLDKNMLEKNKAKNLTLDKSAFENLIDLTPDKTLTIVPDILDNTIATYGLSENKILAIYFTDSKHGVPFDFKALALSENFDQHIKFCVFLDPPDKNLKQFGITSPLPQIVGTLPLKDEYNSKGQYPVFHYPNQMKSNQLVPYFQQLILQVFSEEFEAKNDIRKLKIVEMTHENANSSCYNKNGICIVSLLSALSQEDLTNHLNIIKEAMKKSIRIQATIVWVNVSCHPEFVRTFYLDIMAIPNIVAVIPKKKVFANMIGHFDVDSIKEFIAKLANSKGIQLNPLNSFPIPKEVECTLIQPTKDEPLSEEEKKLLEEVIEEEKNKKEQLKTTKRKKKIKKKLKKQNESDR